MEFGGVGRSVGLVVTGTLRAATAVKLSRPEVIAISRTADAIVAMLTDLGVVLLRDVSAMRRNRESVVFLSGCGKRVQVPVRIGRDDAVSG